MSTNSLDCVIVGYNDIAIRQMNESLKTSGAASGAWRTVLHNTVELSGRRLNYMGLLNAALRETLHADPELHVMKMPSLAICYLKSFLARRGLNVEYINFFDVERERLAALLRRGVNAVAITTTFYVDADPIVEIVQFIRQHSPDTVVVVGGPHIFNICNDYEVTTQNYLLRAIGADVYIHEGQGEDTLAKLLHALRQSGPKDLDGIPNLVFNARLKTRLSGGPPPPPAPARPANPLTSFVRTRREIENNSMDDNVIDWRHFPKDFYTPTVQMRTARSCAFKCAFCSYPVMAGPLTLTSIDAIEREMTELKSGGVENLVFIDDTFNVPLPRFKQLLRMMVRNKFDFNWFSYFRCSNSDDETFELMAESGCRGVFLGIESGDQDILLKMNKAAAIPRYEYGLRKLNQYGIVSFASFIVGFPGETRESVQNTIDFIERTRPTFYRAQLYYHRTNLPIEQKAEQYGLRGGGYSWHHDSMGWEEACDLIERMYLTIEGSTILPEATFDFWSIPYLIGVGIPMEQIVKFARTSQELLLRGLRAGRGEARRQDDEGAVFRELVAACSEMAPHLRARAVAS